MHARPHSSAPASARQARAYRHWQRGVELKGRGKDEQAIDEFHKAVRLDPGDSVYWLNLAHTAVRLARHDVALAAAQRAIAIDPAAAAPACEIAAEQLLRSHRYEETIATIEALPRDLERSRDLHLLHVTALLGAGHKQRAVRAAMAAIGADLAHPRSHYLLGCALSDLQLFEEAAEAFRTAWVLDPTLLEALEMSVHRRQHACRWEGFDSDVRAIERAYAGGTPKRSVPFALMAMPVGPGTQRAAAAVHARLYAARPGGRARATARRVRPAGRLRIGYLSNDFARHATTQLMIEMLERHDRNAFDVVLYSHADDDGTPMRRRVEAACSRFVDISRVDDERAAAMIGADGIDILVDLKGYTTGARSGILGRRPAPLQAGFLGYPGTCGGDFLDYFIGDPVTTPPQMAPYFSEKLAQMPHCYQPNDSTRALPPAVPRAALGLPEDAFVMCSFNQAYKITPDVFDVWCTLLRDIPGSVLWLMPNSAQATRNLTREAEARGVEAGRLLFAPPLPLEQHLARLQAADVFVDTTPCSAHTTASDALWAGLPLVTVCGDTFASRVAASLLAVQGVPELVAHDLGRYAEIVRALAAEPARRTQLRQRLAGVRREGPLFDGARFARDLEALYLRMAERARAGLAPDHLWAQQEPVRDANGEVEGRSQIACFSGDPARRAGLSSNGAPTESSC